MAAANEIYLHEKQMEVYKAKSRFKVVVAGRRWGKCLERDTLISMSDGTKKPIHLVKPGDFVLTVNEDTLQIESKCVVAVQCNGIRESVKIKTSGRSVICTPHHPFMVNGKWTEARCIKPTDLLATCKKDGDVGWEFVIGVEPHTQVETWDLQIEDNHNFFANGIVSHNSILARTMMIKYARVPRRLVWYVAPSYRMAKDIMWPELKWALPRKWIKRINETSLEMTLINGTRVALRGADNPDSLRGVGVHFLVMDEVQDIDPEAWTKVLRPTLASTGGHVLFIGSPKSYNHLYDLYMLGQDGKNRQYRRWMSWQFPTSSSPFIPWEEIEAAKADMDEKSFNQEFMASFEMMSGRVYYSFDREEHLKDDIEFNPDLPIWVGQDFNLDPMSSVIMQPQKDGTVHIVDEIVLHGSNTEEVCEEIEKRYWRWQGNVIIFPDPAGQYGQHARGESDLDIFRERGFKRLRYHKKHPLISDRVNAVNRMLKSADGQTRLFIHPKCKGIISSLEQTIYKQGTREIDKNASVEHSADALGYCIHYQFPTRNLEIVGVSI